MSPWDHLLHRLWKRVGEPGMQCRGPHVEPGQELTVRFDGRDGIARSEHTGTVDAVMGHADSPMVRCVVLRGAP